MTSIWQPVARDRTSDRRVEGRPGSPGHLGRLHVASADQQRIHLAEAVRRLWALIIRRPVRFQSMHTSFSSLSAGTRTRGAGTPVQTPGHRPYPLCTGRFALASATDRRFGGFVPHDAEHHSEELIDANHVLASNSVFLELVQHSVHLMLVQAHQIGQAAAQ